MTPAADPADGGVERPTPERPRVERLSREVPAAGEAFHRLAALGSARVEHIVSSDTPDPALQVLAWDEWVLVLSGAAELEVSGQRLRLSAEEWLVLPAGTPHRVLTTASGTHWLAVHAAAQPTDQP